MNKQVEDKIKLSVTQQIHSSTIYSNKRTCPRKIVVAKRPKTNVCTAVIAVPQIRENPKNKKKRKIDINSPPDDKGTRIWRVLLDSRADGDFF